MNKDYHKGKKIQCYIPEELAEALEDCAKKYNISKTRIIIEALYTCIFMSTICNNNDSIDKD